MEPKFLLYTDFSGILNFKTFSVVPSISHEKVKNVLFHYKATFLIQFK
jgi:hypothetical protein